MKLFETTQRSGEEVRMTVYDTDLELFYTVVSARSFAASLRPSLQFWLNDYGSRRVQRYIDLRAYGHNYWASSRESMRSLDFLSLGEFSVKSRSVQCKKEESKPSGRLRFLVCSVRLFAILDQKRSHII